MNDRQLAYMRNTRRVSTALDSVDNTFTVMLQSRYMPPVQQMHAEVMKGLPSTKRQFLVSAGNRVLVEGKPFITSACLCCAGGVFCLQHHGEGVSSPV